MIRTFALAFALACAAMSAPLLAPPAIAQQVAAFSVDSTLGALLGNAGARAVLERQIPDVIANPQIAQAGSMTLRQLAQYVPALTAAKLTEINAELAGVR